MATTGEASEYYNDQQASQPNQQPQRYQETKSGYAPPTYGQDFNASTENKHDFAQTFKIEKPKLNDLWAGVLVGGLNLNLEWVTD